jgi:hypothetical protein
MVQVVANPATDTDAVAKVAMHEGRTSCKMPSRIEFRIALTKHGSFCIPNEMMLQSHFYDLVPVVVRIQVQKVADSS